MVRYLEFAEELRPEGGQLIACSVAGPIPCGSKDAAGFYFHLKALKQAGLWGERAAHERSWPHHHVHASHRIACRNSAVMTGLHVGAASTCMHFTCVRTVGEDRGSTDVTGGAACMRGSIWHACMHMPAVLIAKTSSLTHAYAYALCSRAHRHHRRTAADRLPACTHASNPRPSVPFCGAAEAPAAEKAPGANGTAAAAAEGGAAAAGAEDDQPPAG